MTLRDTIEASYDAVMDKDQTVGTPQTPAPAQSEVTPVTPVETPVAAPADADPQKLGRTAGRPRDEHGRLLPGKPEKPETAPVAAAPAAASPAAPTRPAVQRPSSWKKDHWEAFDKIALENPQLAEYIAQRESEFARGVSTYKQEYENVKPLADAMQPIIPILQQAGINPHNWISQMGQAHYTLAYGTQQQKLQMLAQIAQNNNIPLQVLYDPQAQQQFLMQQTLQPQAPVSQPDVDQILEQKLATRDAIRDLQQFEAAKDASGNPLYAHYETVRQTMSQLLESGIAQDLQSAYETALIAPQHRHLWEAEQAAKTAASQKAAQDTRAKQVAQAKAAAVSTRSATPAGEASAGKPKGIRANVEAAYDAVMAERGRI